MLQQNAGDKGLPGLGDRVRHEEIAGFAHQEDVIVRAHRHLVAT